jgi:DivIVA domain-containing protein
VAAILRVPSAWHDRGVPLVFGILVSVAVIFAMFAVTIGRGGSMTKFQPDWPGRALPEDRTVRADDVASARFSLAFRGYRMIEVDDALDRLASEIAQRDAVIEGLSGRPFESQRTVPASVLVDVDDPADSVDRVDDNAVEPDGAVAHRDDRGVS